MIEHARPYQIDTNDFVPFAPVIAVLHESALQQVRAVVAEEVAKVLAQYKQEHDEAKAERKRQKKIEKYGWV